MKKISKVGKALKIAVALFVSRAIFKTKAENKADTSSQNKPVSSMKTSLEGVPKSKREELQHAVKIICHEANPEMIILFGSYARGDAVEVRGPDGNFEYQSDLDIYVLVKKRKQARKIGRWNKLRQMIRRDIRTPIEILVDSIGYFNNCLQAGQYFFTDIKNEGILLYDSKQFQLEEARKLSIEARRKKAEEHFEEWFNSAEEFFKDFQSAFARQSYKNAAFHLHQATERFYSAVLLVFTDYRPKLHDIEELGRLASMHDPIFQTVFPRDSEEEQRLFGLLKKAYIDARYRHKDYSITKDELERLVEHVIKLRNLTEEVCKKKIESFIAKADDEQTAALTVAGADSGGVA
jgi:HEPN domain-containing protein/predicted nucleotidyltransferase